MRKLIWCCSAAGLLSAGAFVSIAGYAYLHPESPVGQAMTTAAQASLTMQPLTGLASLAIHTTQPQTHETCGSAEECVPDDPQPIAPEVHENNVVEQERANDPDAAPIVIGEEEPMPAENVVQAVPATIDMNVLPDQQMPPNGCPVVMPYCQDDDEQQPIPPAMPYADAEEAKPAKQDEAKKSAGEESEQTVFKEWQLIFEEGQKKDDITIEQLPPPREEEEPQEEPKCEEDPHRHEHYSGCPTITCPYTGKSYPAHVPAKRSGREESSEEPVPHSKKSHSGKGCKGEECPRTQGVDTMEYRSSDGGLNEYGPNPQY